MKILLLTLGTRGDVQPFFTLALELQSKGHSATIVSHPYMSTWMADYGIDFIPVGPDINLHHISNKLRKLQKNWVKALTNLSQSIMPIMESVSPVILDLYGKYDFAILPPSSFGKVEADYIGINHACVLTHPQAIPGLRYQKTPIISLLERLYIHFIDYSRLSPYNKFRAKFGLHPLYQYKQMLSPSLNLFPISKHIIDRPTHWTTKEHITGYWFSDSPTDWLPPVDLVKYLEKGPPPVVVSLGAMEQCDTQSKNIITMLIQAVKKLGIRGVIQTRYPEAYQNFTSQHIFLCGEVHHDWLLPKSRCIIHHCGFGSTAAGLRAGIPAVALPFAMDQNYWASQLQMLGVSPPVLNYKKMRRNEVTQAIESAYFDETMHTIAAQLSQKISQENGPSVAVRLIEEVL